MRCLGVLLLDVCDSKWLQSQENCSAPIRPAMSLNGTYFGISSTTIRQQLSDLRDPCYDYRYPPFYHRKSRLFPIQPDIEQFETLSLNSTEPKLKSRLHRFYHSLLRRGTRNPVAPEKYCSLPHGAFRIKKDSNREIAKTRQNAWSGSNSNVFRPPSSRLPNYNHSSLIFSSPGEIVIPPINPMFNRSFDHEADFKSPITHPNASSRQSGSL